MKRIITPHDSLEIFKKIGGGKAYNMARLTQKNILVPDWFCISADAYAEFISANNLNPEELINPAALAHSAMRIEESFLKASLPPDLVAEIQKHLAQAELNAFFVAVRSSGLDEDSAQNSFAGQFSSFLFQKGLDAISFSLKKMLGLCFFRKSPGLPYRKKYRHHRHFHGCHHSKDGERRRCWRFFFSQSDQGLGSRSSLNQFRVGLGGGPRQRRTRC